MSIALVAIDGKMDGKELVRGSYVFFAETKRLKGHNVTLIKLEGGRPHNLMFAVLLMLTKTRTSILRVSEMIRCLVGS